MWTLLLVFLALGMLGAIHDRRKRRAAVAPCRPTPSHQTVPLFVVIHPDPDTWRVVGRYTREPLARLTDGDDAHQLAAAFSALLDCVDAEVAAAAGGLEQLEHLRAVTACRLTTAEAMASVDRLGGLTL